MRTAEFNTRGIGRQYPKLIFAVGILEDGGTDHVETCDLGRGGSEAGQRANGGRVPEISAVLGGEGAGDTWYAVKLGGAKFGIFDTFADEKGREAHLTGEIAKELFGKAQDLFIQEPKVHKLDILAAKVPGGAKVQGA